jgi:hypothetical protein
MDGLKLASERQKRSARSGVGETQLFGSFDFRGWLGFGLHGAGGVFGDGICAFGATLPALHGALSDIVGRRLGSKGYGGTGRKKNCDCEDIFDHNFI